MLCAASGAPNVSVRRAAASSVGIVLQHVSENAVLAQGALNTLSEMKLQSEAQYSGVLSVAHRIVRAVGRKLANPAILCKMLLAGVDHNDHQIVVAALELAVALADINACVPEGISSCELR